MTITSKPFGSFEGRQVDQFTLTSDTGVEVDILTWGVVVRDWRVPVKGAKRSVVLGFDSFDPYPDHSPHFGSIAGRVANRIGNAAFDLDGKTYRLPANFLAHTLHGGPEGLGRQVWQAEADHARNAVTFTHTSPDGHMGFPGEVKFTITYHLVDYKLSLNIHASTDARTPINVVQHQYFNLGTDPLVIDHSFWIDADQYTEVDGDLIPTGRNLSVDGTKWDLRQPRVLRDDNWKIVEYDGNLLLRPGRDPGQPVAEVVSPDGDLTLRLWTDRPGVQLYTSPWTDVDVPGGPKIGKYTGFCLEDQDLPDAVNHPEFPSIIYGPGKDYVHSCDIEIR